VSSVKNEIPFFLPNSYVSQEKLLPCQWQGILLLPGGPKVSPLYPGF